MKLLPNPSIIDTCRRVAGTTVWPNLVLLTLALLPQPISAAAPAKALPVNAQPAPAAVLDPASWTVPEIKGNTFVVGQAGGKPVVTAGAKSLLIATPEKIGPDTRIRVLFRFADPALRGGMTLAAGLASGSDLKEKGLYITL